jgi:hypothetical protein
LTPATITAFKILNETTFSALIKDLAAQGIDTARGGAGGRGPAGCPTGTRGLGRANWEARPFSFDDAQHIYKPRRLRGVSVSLKMDATFSACGPSRSLTTLIAPKRSVIPSLLPKSFTPLYLSVDGHLATEYANSLARPDW